MTNEPLETLLQTGLRSRPEPDLICFDIFDTLLTRTVGSPEGIFLQLGERLWAEKRTSMTPEEFARARVSAERRARSNLVTEKEISLSQIYEEIKAVYPKIGLTVSEFTEAELEIEKESLVTIPGAIDALLLARQRTKKIAFVSDMYLPEIFIKDVLIEQGLADNRGLLYVSSSRKVTKVGGGRLFKCLLEELGVNPKNVIHIGDSWLSDIKPANALGIQAIHYKGSQSNRYERELEEARWSCRGLSSGLSGASKLTRVKHSADYLDPAFLTVAAGVAAPLFTSFGNTDLFRPCRSAVSTELR